MIRPRLVDRLRTTLRVLRGLQLGHDVDDVLREDELRRAAAAGMTRREYLGLYVVPNEVFSPSAESPPADGPTAPGPLHLVADVGPQLPLPALGTDDDPDPEPDHGTARCGHPLDACMCEVCECEACRRAE